MSNPFFTSNSTYNITTDITLESDTVIPDNVTLIFQGGKILSNTPLTLTGQRTRIVAPICQIFGEDIEVDGSWDIDRAYPQWFGYATYQTPVDYLPPATCRDAGPAINKAIKMKQMGEVFLPKGIYVIATPAIAALFCGIFRNSVFSMACASSLMFLLILLTYYWSFRPILSKSALWTGVFCMTGATILGDSISSSTYGFQILYTMASYYACYLLVILLHLSIWVRFGKARMVSPVLIGLALAASLALGIQSQREMLALCIPFLLITLVLWLKAKTDSGEKKGFLFAAASLGANLIGLCGNGYIRQHAGSQYLSNVSSAEAAGADAFGTRFAESGRAFLDLVGLRYLHYGWKWKLLAVLGCFLLIVALAALVICMKKRDRMGSRMLLFCWLSLFGVFTAGILVVRVRAIYYFVWYLLIPLSISFLLEHCSAKRKPLLCAAVLFCGAMN